MGKQLVSAESIARLADKEEDISAYFTNDGEMMLPLESGEIDPSEDAVEELSKETKG